MQPWPDYANLAPNTRFYLDHGVKGLFQEGAYQSYGSDMAEMKNYLMSKLLFDPVGTNASEVTSEFLRLFYGEAASPHLQSYIDLWSGAVADSRYYLTEHEASSAAYLSPSALLKSAALIEAALAGVEASGAVQGPEPPEHYARRVREAKLPTLYVILLRFQECREYAASHGVPWPYAETDVGSAFATFSAIFEDIHGTLLSESGHDLAWLKQQIHA